MALLPASGPVGLDLSWLQFSQLPLVQSLSGRVFVLGDYWSITRSHENVETSACVASAAVHSIRRSKSPGKAWFGSGHGEVAPQREGVEN